MARKNAVPSYLRHKASGQAFVRIAGKNVYLGKFDSTESKQLYRQICKQLESKQERALLDAKPEAERGATVREMCATYLVWADGYYRRDGTLTREYADIKVSFRELGRLYGESIAEEFSPRCLVKVREAMVKAGLCKNVINQRIGRIRRLFRKAVEWEIVDGSVLVGLQAVCDLALGRGDVRETEPIGAVEWADVKAILPWLPSKQLRAMVLLQWFVGMRPGEVCGMKREDLHAGSITVERKRIQLPPGVMAYLVPAKMAHKRKDKWQVYFIGPVAMRLLRPWLDREGYLFVPREAKESRYRRLRAARKTRVQPSQRSRSKPEPRRTPGERYSVSTYDRAVERAIGQENAWRAERDLEPIEKWHPHQLRHAAKMRFEELLSLEGARRLLGHTHIATTDLYGTRDLKAAAEDAKKIG